MQKKNDEKLLITYNILRGDHKILSDEQNDLRSGHETLTSEHTKR